MRVAWRCRVALVLAALSPWFGLACRHSEGGQQEGRRDRQLERRVGELLPRVEELSHLAVRRVPAVRRASRATLETYLLARLDAEYPGDTLESLALVYRTFGLLPDTVDLRSLLVELLLEQAVGYYDPARDVLFLREEVPAAMLDAVLVHELVHALQDQQMDLDSLIESRPGNDARTAVQAALEGHATVVMVTYQIAEATGSTVAIDQLPDLGPEMASVIADASTMPLLAEAPSIVREPLLFAYLGGARFVQRLWRSRTEEPPPFGEWLPESTEQLLHTERLLTERDRPSRLVLSEPGAGWRVRYASDLGELELRIYFEQHLSDRELAERAAAGWDGDAYALLWRGEEWALVWYTVWDTDADADEFSDAYRAAFAARFGGGAGGELVAGGREARLERLTVEGRPAVRVVESPPGIRLEAVPRARFRGSEGG